ncbi:MAG: hypothetical protein ACI4D0_06445 [Lachnospira sp.]
MKKVLISGTATIVICIALLFLTALIPQNALQKNMEKSSDYYNNHQLFDHVTDYMFLSRQDNYADCILTNIIYHIDKNNLVESVLSASYYNPEDEDVQTSFAYAVVNKVEPDVDYSRYWHGSMVLLRPLFVIFDIAGVRMALGILILIMTVWFEILLFKNHYSIYGVCYGIGLMLVSVWMCAFCVEYAMPFVVMSVELPVLFVLLTRAYERKDAQKLDNQKADEHKSVKCKPEVILWAVLACAGIVTAFVDFLTTETITFTMAYVLYIIVKNRHNQMKPVKEELICLIKSGIVWLASYGLMIVLKWVLALVALGKDAFFNALSQAALRISGDATLGNVPGAEVVSNYERISGALWRNMGCIYPFKSTMSYGTSMIFIFLVGLIVFSIWYLFREKTKSCINKVLVIVSLIPVLRFLVLNNHSYIHFFFTYRALLVSVVVIMYILTNCVSGFVRKRR